jgi:hypothetical protein
MPVKTRSQYRKDNIEVNLNSDNTRQVKFITPEKSTRNISCPPTPRAPRASKIVYSSFGNAARQLDFNYPSSKIERYPFLYKNFIIANKFQKKKVDNFLVMIAEYTNQPLKDDPSNVKTPKNQFQKDQLFELCDDELLQMAKTLNSNATFWKIFNENEYNSTTLNSAVYHWANLLSSTILIYLLRVTKQANSIPVVHSRNIITDKITPNLIIFRDVIMNEKFPRFSISRRFLGTIIQKMLSFASSGYVLAPLVIRHYYPDMVTKECYPIVNVYPPSEVYTHSLDYAHSTYEQSILKLFNECQPIYNFS